MSELAGRHDTSEAAAVNDALKKPGTATWPAHFPEKCPPADAGDAHGVEIFRLVKSIPPTDKDWCTHWELGASPNADPCQRCGLSCAMEAESLRRLRDLVPYRRHNKIVVGTLDAGVGVVRQTGEPWHHTLWVRAEFASNIGKFFEEAA